jgi:hypothetical protein
MRVRARPYKRCNRRSQKDRITVMHQKPAELANATALTSQVDKLGRLCGAVAIPANANEGPPTGLGRHVALRPRQQTAVGFSPSRLAVRYAWIVR